MPQRLETALTFSLVLAALLYTGCATASSAQPKDRKAVFFSNGQALYDPQNQAASQQQAIHEFLVQALTQATASFMSPTQMGTQFANLQKKVLSQPEKYAESYQVYSEAPSGGLYRVVGQVTVAMDMLGRDLKEQGFATAEAQPEKAEAAAQTRPEPEAESPRVASNSASPAAEAEQEPAREPAYGRGLMVTQKEILWAVPEKWEQQWFLPYDKRDTHALFALSMDQELQGLRYSLQFPDSASVRMDTSGNIPTSQVLSLAEAQGIRRVVVGTVALRQGNGKAMRLETLLRVLDAPSGKAAGEVRSDQPLDELTNQEGAMELAARVAPQLDKLAGLLGEKPAGVPEIKEAGGEDAHAASAQIGDWVLHLPPRQYAYWRELEKVLRDQSKSMEVTGLDMGSDESTVSVGGIDGAVISRMNGSVLPSGAQVTVEKSRTGGNAFTVSFTPPGKPASEQQQ